MAYAALNLAIRVADILPGIDSVLFEDLGYHHGRSAWVSSPSATEPVAFPGPETLIWQDDSAIGLQSFNVYRGALPELTRGSLGSRSSGVPRFNSSPCP